MGLLLSLLHLCTEAAHNYAEVNDNCTSLKIMNGYGIAEYECKYANKLTIALCKLLRFRYLNEISINTLVLTYPEETSPTSMEN